MSARKSAVSVASLERRLSALVCDDAVFGLHRLVGIDAPRFLRPYALSAHRHFDPGPCEELIADVERASDRLPKSGRLHALRGRLLRALGRKEEALSAFERALALEPGDARARAWRAELLLHMDGRRAEGVAALGAAPEDPAPLVWAAAVALNDSAGPEVFAALDAALARAPRHVPALLLRAVAHERCGRADRALADAVEAARLEPDCVGALVLRGRVEARLGKIDAALASFDAATRLEPEAKEFYGEIAVAHLPPGAAVCGVKELDRYLAAHPDAAWAWALKGDRIRAAGGATARGLAELKRAAALDPRTPWIRACMARTQVQILRSRRGLDGLRAAIRRDPRCGWLHSWYAEAHRVLGRPEEALPIFRRAIRLSPRFPQTHVWLGRVYGEAGRWNEALREFDRAIRLDCDYAFAYAKRGDCLARLGRRAEAVPDFDRALELDCFAQDWIRALRRECARAPRKDAAQERATKSTRLPSGS